MPISLTGLKKKVGKVTLFGDLNVEYYLVPLGTWEDTIETDKLLKDADDATRLRHQAKNLINVVASWDLLDDETEKPIPLTQDAICAKVPHSLIIDILTAIAEDRDPNSLKGSTEQSSAPLLPV